MADELKPVDLLEHPEADLSANAEKGAAVGGAAGVLAGALAGSPFGPAGAAIGAVIGGVAGAVGTSVVVAATDTQGENHSEKIQEESDATIARNELPDDSRFPTVQSLFDSEEKNSVAAFERSFRLGFGTETDIRDLNGNLVISHDPPLEGAMTFEAFLEIYLSFNSRPRLALNVKADGLQKALARVLSLRAIENYFVFDMAVPDMLGYFKENLKVFTRQSDLEPNPICLSETDGIWMDTMRSEWVLKEHIDQWLKEKKQICIVSPELHGRPHENGWRQLLDWGFEKEPNIMICTDFPEAASALLSE